MRAQRGLDTAPELHLRRALHRRGLRYRLQVPLLPGLRRKVDIAFGAARVVVEVRGCFWHACPQHATQPKANGEWWLAKLEANRRRDADTEQRLREAGWAVVVVWEHDDMEAAADRIAAIVRNRRPPGLGRRG